MNFSYPVINLEKTGQKIKKLREAKNLSVRDLQEILGFESPQAIYKWQWGESLPTLDNLVILAKIFECKIEDILVISEL
ncbi:MAG TPA: helix-turn-helix transcriptional regulator [Acholeplasmataceae bacterium]|jgi:transcriptional regulator with XRE-family HTH domain|nr:helix-turn-helix transcriptional regulator [Acholeplasmataceae bacterium]HPX71935.1 helix-turn-helix transcriptional regulator [Acholeplasmataceae bacterium]HQC30854.1 helix-turn-helix transcriptional regulator [Acholeplasmataceae bacterium]